MGDITEENFQRDIILEYRKNGLQRITNLFQSFLSMTYPLIHSYGEDEYRLGIKLADVINKTCKRQKLSMRLILIRIQQRLDEGKIILLDGRLLQQYIFYGYMLIEEERFCKIRNNQTKLMIFTLA